MTLFTYMIAAVAIGFAKKISYSETKDSFIDLRDIIETKTNKR